MRVKSDKLFSSSPNSAAKSSSLLLSVLPTRIEAATDAGSGVWGIEITLWPFQRALRLCGVQTNEGLGSSVKSFGLKLSRKAKRLRIPGHNRDHKSVISFSKPSTPK